MSKVSTVQAAFSAVLPPSQMVNFVFVYYVGIASDFVCICAMSHRCGRDLGHLDFLCIFVFFVFLYSVS